MTTLLESKARPYGSGKGAAVSVVLHGALIAAAVVASGAVALPPREKIEEHPVLYVAAPPPPKVHVAPEPLPEVKKPPAAKTPAPRRVAPPPPRPSQPQPRPAPVTAATPRIVAPISVPVSLPPVDLKAAPITDVVALPPPELPKSSSSSSSGTKSSSDGDVARGSGKGGLGSGDAGRAFNASQVDREVQMTRPAVPRYPDALRSVSVTGEVKVRYIVDTRGRVEPNSIQVISATHRLFAEAVRVALLGSRFRPAEANGQPVRQLVEQPFIFKLDP